MAEAMTKEEASLFELLTLECKVDARGTVRHFNAQGQLHRVHGPAVERPNGYRAWYQNGLLHRLDGPAIEYTNGRREWYQKDLLHRLDGPAIEYPDGRRWHINGKELTETEWQQTVASMGLFGRTRTI